MGGVMLESTEWHGGLRDRTQVTPEHLRREVDQEIESVLKKIRETIFPIHTIT
jgi:hypothetical protein